MVALAGSRTVGDEPFNEIFHPITERLLDRCDVFPSRWTSDGG